MTENDQKQLRAALWAIADQLRGAMNADDFRDYMLTSSKPEYLWNNIAELARTQSGELLETLHKGFKYSENESFQNTFQSLFSDINLDSESLASATQNATPSSEPSSARLLKGSDVHYR